MLRSIPFVLMVMLISPALAEDIKLNADNRVEYHQHEQKLVAIGNAVASKGNMSIKAHRLVGFYDAKNKNKISRVEAHQNVVMSSDQTKAWGDDMIYDVKADSAVLTGKPARIKTPDGEISSSGSITYWQSKQTAVAENNVIATDKRGNKIFSDKMTAHFVKDKAEKLAIGKVDIAGNVKIVTKDGEITADSGTYFADDRLVKLFNNITINQKGNILKGDLAETNLNTGISKILSNKKGRVSGVFKETKKEKNK